MWFLQELFDFLKFFKRFIGTGNVGKGDLRVLFVDQLCAALAEVHDTAATALSPRHQEPENCTDDDKWQEGAKQREVPRSGLNVVVVALLDVCRSDRVGNSLASLIDIEELNLLAVGWIGRD